MNLDASIKVPFVDLHAQYASIKGEIDDAIARVINQSAFVRGPFVDAFERDFSALCGRRYCVSCGNGTDSLYIAMVALGVNIGDEVIVPAHSWISTAETVTQAGGTVVFCDTEPDTFTIDPQDIERKITNRTVGIIPVHLYGQAADMDPILAIARKHKLWVLEDCAQAHLSTYRGRKVGTFGNVASFSFYPGKNLGAMGDGGALVTDDPALAEKMTMFARHGGLVKGVHEIEGINSRLDGLQAAILSVKMRYLEEWTARRRSVAVQYTDLLASVDNLTLPAAPPDRGHVWHLYVVKCKARDHLAQFLRKGGVQTSINYPIALPFLPAYSRFRHKPDDFPNAYKNQQQVLSLPVFPELQSDRIILVADLIKDFLCDDSSIR